MDDLAKVREHRAEAEEHLLDLLRAPYYRMSPWAITSACTFLKHPTPRWDDPPSKPCICGKRKGAVD